MMVDLAEIQAAYYMVAATGVLVAAGYYVLNMRATLQTRQAQLFMQIFQRFQEPEFTKKWSSLMDAEWSDYDDYMNRISSNPDHSADRLSVQTYFEGVAVLLMKNMIDVDFVYELMPTMVTTFWKKYEPIVKVVRERLNYPQWFRPVEYLSDRMIEQAKRRGDPVVLSYRGNSEAND
jgi:hypothetical protein